MSADTETKKPAEPLGPESQGQRWAKYGSNVALMIVLAIVLAGLVTYIAQAHDLRLDTTAGGVNSLRPQTMSVLHNLGSDIKLVSLYSKAETSSDTSPDGRRPIDKPRFVSDLLDNYKRSSSRISVEAIDPADKAKVDALVADLDQRYGKDIKAYRDYLADYTQTGSRRIAQLITAEQAKFGAAPGGDDSDKYAPQIRESISGMLPWIETDKKDLDRHLQDKRPDYHGLVSQVRSTLDKISQREQKIVEFFQKHKADAEASEPTRAYMTESVGRHQGIKAAADEQIARIEKLGELKVDELQRALNVPNPILVLGPTDWRVIQESQVWPESRTARQFTEGKVAPSFAGEQQITTAIISLTATKKPRVVFLRPGGAPLAAAGFPPFQPGGPFSEFAERLRQYNFDVIEKDLSGQYAMQAQMRGMPPQPEPGWEELNDAVWILIDAGGAQPGSEPIAPRLAAHLGHGGSALILAFPQGDNLESVLGSWGVDLHADLIAVHEQIPQAGGATGSDFIQQALRRPYIWDFKDYGNSALARPLKNLECLMVSLVPVTTHDASGYQVTPLIPIPDAPQAPRSWGKKDLSSLQEGAPPKYEPDKGDLGGRQLYAGAAVEKNGGGRLVVIGSGMFATDEVMTIPDPEIAREEGRVVSRFPGNGELAENSVFWCAKMDSMIALSPAALQVSRIADMSNLTLGFWRFGLLLVGLPLLVIAAGIGMYLNRRD